jgi:hypothetical protein
LAGAVLQRGADNRDQPPAAIGASLNPEVWHKSLEGQDFSSLVSWGTFRHICGVNCPSAMGQQRLMG